MRTKFFTLFIIIILSSIAFSQTLPSFDEVYNKAKKLNPEMKDCQAKLNFKFNVHIGVPIKFQMDGEYFYKTPDKYKIKLKRTPAYLKKHPQIFSWALPNKDEFNCKLKGEEKVKELVCYLIELEPKQPMGDLIKHILWINCKNYTIAKQTFTYNHNGKIDVFQNYKVEKGFLVFDNLIADFSFSNISLKATVEAIYTNYLFNQNLPDSLFK